VGESLGVWENEGGATAAADFNDAPLLTARTAHPPFWLQLRKVTNMKYLIAWGLGVPFSLVLVWFVFSNAC
jgi:hypothetical protein